MTNKIYDEPVFVDELPGRTTLSSERLRTLIAGMVPRLKANHGKWAVIAEYDGTAGAGSLVKSLKDRYGLTAPDWEVRMRKVKLGEPATRVYVCYVGEPAKAPGPRVVPPVKALPVAAQPSAPPRPPAPPAAPLPPAKPPARPQTARMLNDSFALCACSHTQRRHLDQGEGYCAAAGCGCGEFRLVEAEGEPA